MDLFLGLPWNKTVLGVHIFHIITGIPVLLVLLFHYYFLHLDPQLKERGLIYISLIIFTALNTVTYNIWQSYLGLVHVLSLGIFIHLTCGYIDLNIVVDYAGQ